MLRTANIFKIKNHFGHGHLLLTLATGHLVNDFYGLILPFLLPSLIVAFDLSYVQAGLLALATTILSGVLEPLLGFIADKYGIRKKIVLAGFLLFSLSLTVISLASTYSAILVACFIAGVGGSTFHAQSTNFLTTAFAQAKGRVMGLHGLGGSVGNFIAPLTVAGLISWFGWRTGAQLLVIPGLVIAGLLWVRLHEPAGVKSAGFRGSFNPSLLILALNFGLILMLYKGFLTFLPTYLVERGATLNAAGGVSSLMLLVGLFAQPAGGLLYDRWGGRAVFLLGAIGSGLALWLFSLSSGIFMIVYLGLVGAFTSALFPVALAMASQISRDGQVGLSVGVVFGLSGTLSALTPLLTGYMADLFDLNLAFKLLVILAMLSAGCSLWLPAAKTGDA